MSAPLQVAFIVGSPRSGTTILQEILGIHPQIGHFYEPYYIWYFHVKDQTTDYIPGGAISQKETKWIRNKFILFGKLLGKNFVLDKLPEHSFNLPILTKVFPNAKIIHIIRDGRDVVLSIKKEWKRRQRIVEHRGFGGLLRTATNMFRRQPFWRFRALALWHELKNNFSLNPSRYLNKAKWKGEVGWGPRFIGWEKVLHTESLIRFHAYQWLNCIAQIQKDLPSVSRSNVFTLRYEDMVSDNYQYLVSEIMDFLQLPCTRTYIGTMPKIRLGNTKKWQKELSQGEIKEIGPIVADKLIELGYESNKNWYAY